MFCFVSNLILSWRSSGPNHNSMLIRNTCSHRIFVDLHWPLTVSIIKVLSVYDFTGSGHSDLVHLASNLRHCSVLSIQSVIWTFYSTIIHKHVIICCLFCQFRKKKGGKNNIQLLVVMLVFFFFFLIYLFFNLRWSHAISFLFSIILVRNTIFWLLSEFKPGNLDSTGYKFPNMWILKYLHPLKTRLDAAIIVYYGNIWHNPYWTNLYLITIGLVKIWNWLILFSPGNLLGIPKGCFPALVDGRQRKLIGLD